MDSEGGPVCGKLGIDILKPGVWLGTAPGERGWDENMGVQGRGVSGGTDMQCDTSQALAAYKRLGNLGPDD